MDEEIQATIDGLKSRHHNAVFVENCDEARRIVLDLIPKAAIVGTGDSVTVQQAGVISELEQRGNKVWHRYDPKMIRANTEEAKWYVQKVSEASTLCDVYLSGTNAVTQDGRLVNVDGNCNRIAGMVWGHPITIIVVGRNKIVKNLEEAFHRIRNVIAPSHVKLRIQLGGVPRSTPCAISGTCSDCRAIDRACNFFGIIEGKPHRTKISVVVVNEDLGLGWDENWPQDRINRIIENYKQFVWLPTIEWRKRSREKGEA